VTAAWGALDIHNASAVSLTPYTTFTFAARATQANQDYAVGLVDQNDNQVGVWLDVVNYGGMPPAGSWKLYQIPVSAFQTAGASIYGIVIQDISGGTTQPTLWVDEIGFK
jgi:hypothetical protein